LGRLVWRLFARGKTSRTQKWRFAAITGFWLAAYCEMYFYDDLLFQGFVVFFFLYCYFLLPLNFVFAAARSLRDSRSSGFLEELALTRWSPRSILNAHYWAAAAWLACLLGPGMSMAPAAGWLFEQANPGLGFSSNGLAIFVVAMAFSRRAISSACPRWA
jgi:hypothetical protein